MNSRKLIILVTIALGMFAISTANVGAQMHRTSGFSPRASASRSFAGTRMGTSGGRNWGGRNWGGDWHHRHHDHFGNTIFISGFGFPFLGFGYPYGYGYGGYYPYSYYGGGYYGGGYSGNGYYGGPGYGGYGGGPYGYYGQQGYRSYGYGSRSGVVQMQQRLARAGYYRGPIDGIMGPRTRYALRAYRHDRGTGAYGMMDRQPR